MADRLIYLAAPLFNERERSFNSDLAQALELYASVYLPQRDGSLLSEMVKAGVAVQVAEKRVFQQDCDALRRSNILVAVLDGAHIDEGVAFEIGFARALGCLCVGLQTDTRRALPTGNNPMIQGGLVEIFADKIDLFEFITSETISAERLSAERWQMY
jgi:nucleoside 2-deoxyribosyltransferase